MRSEIISVTTPLYMQDSDRCPASNRRPIIKSMSNFYVTDICTSGLCPFSNSQIGVQLSNLWPFLTFANWRPMTSLTYALTLTLTNKSAIDLRIWKGRQFEIMT